MSRVISAKCWLYSDTFKISLKDEHIDKAIEKFSSIIEERFRQLLEKITVYPPFCDKEQLVKDFIRTLNQEIEENRREIKEEIKGMFNAKDPFEAIFRYITDILKRAEERTEEKYQTYKNYILNSDFPIDFLDDMLMAFHYISKYYRACRAQLRGLRLFYMPKFRSGRHRYQRLAQGILNKTSAFLEDLDDLLVIVKTIELFITIWSAENYEEIIKGEVKWSFRRIFENKDAAREFQTLSWELKEAIRRVRRTEMILKYGSLLRRPISSEKETRVLWDDLLLSMS